MTTKEVLLEFFSAIAKTFLTNEEDHATKVAEKQGQRSRRADQARDYGGMW